MTRQIMERVEGETLDAIRPNPRRPSGHDGNQPCSSPWMSFARNMGTCPQPRTVCTSGWEACWSAPSSSAPCI